MMKLRTLALPAIATLTIALAGCQDGTRENVRAVGSSTVLPFAELVAEMTARANPGAGTPIIEGIGSGAGIQLFCQGTGASTPDIANASRRMKLSEFETCQRNGVQEITEIQVGLDGIVFVSTAGGITMNLTPKIVYEALAASPYGEEQTNETWSDVDPSLPDVPILVYGPPPTSGTRDALKELVLEAGCDTDPRMEALAESDEDRHGQVCTEVRNDGKFVEGGEQDNLIIQKISNNRNAVGVLGYSFLEKNAGRVQGLPVNGFEPTYENISNFSYPGARPLYIYVKNAHLQAIPGLRSYVEEWSKNWGPDGALAARGLVASDAEKRAANLEKATSFTPLTADELS
ncbi:substrate-binding domain-containing protein [Qipengyuania sp. JC766]|uniref:substrate-binding domain-containing protein n=1 Tax=Qipengyuania sp. JC766 TaxID=3232139 RepID=UPI00345A7445